MYDSLLVAVDGSDESKKALELACILANKDDVELHILHVPEPLYYPATLAWGIGVVPMYEDPGELEAAAKLILERAETHARELGVTQVQVDIVKGDPARTIISQAESLNVDAIVIGSRGLGNLTRVIMGGVILPTNGRHLAKRLYVPQMLLG